MDVKVRVNGEVVWMPYDLFRALTSPSKKVPAVSLDDDGKAPSRVRKGSLVIELA